MRTLFSPTMTKYMAEEGTLLHLIHQQRRPLNFSFFKEIENVK